MHTLTECSAQIERVEVPEARELTLPRSSSSLLSHPLSSSISFSFDLQTSNSVVSTNGTNKFQVWPLSEPSTLCGTLEMEYKIYQN